MQTTNDEAAQQTDTQPGATGKPLQVIAGSQAANGNGAHVGAFTKAMLVQEISIELTWPALYVDADGTAIKFKFLLRRMLKSEQDNFETQALLEAKTTTQRRLDLFCTLLISCEGFDDFPATSKAGSTLMSVRAREYFSDEGMADFVKYAMGAYDNAVVPREFFRLL